MIGFAWARRLWRWLRPRRTAEPERTLSIDEITARALAILHQKVNLVGALNHAYDEDKAKAGVEPGSSLRIRPPVQYKTGD